MTRSRVRRTAHIASCILAIVGGSNAVCVAHSAQNTDSNDAVRAATTEHVQSVVETGQGNDHQITSDQLLKLITKQAPLAQVEYVAQLQGALRTPGLRESSGIAQSRRDAAVVWTHNDSGYGPYLFAFDKQARGLGRVLLNKVRAYDWEDMAAFTWNAEPWLLIADTGDNASRRPSSTLYLLREPDLGNNQSQQLIKRNVDIVLKFRYPDGPADTESVAVDEQEQKIYLLTKRQRPPRLYSIALPDSMPSTTDSPPSTESKGSENIVVAKFETTLHPLPRPTVQDLIDHPKFGWHKSQPTAMDFASSSDYAVIQTYGFGYLFFRSKQQTWADALAQQPVQFALPTLEQGEALAIARDGKTLLCTSEGKDAPLYQLKPNFNLSTFIEGSQP